jgi:hypothetical protein
VTGEIHKWHDLVELFEILLKRWQKRRKIIEKKFALGVIFKCVLGHFKQVAQNVSSEPKKK